MAARNVHEPKAYQCNHSYADAQVQWCKAQLEVILSSKLEGGSCSQIADRLVRWWICKCETQGNTTRPNATKLLSAPLANAG